MLNTPKPLVEKDKVALLACASAIQQKHLDTALDNIYQLGLEPVVPDDVFAKDGYFAGTVSHRLANMHAAFKDKSIKAIFNIRGGFGSAALLENLDYALIQNNPKFFVGYSDITALLNVLYREARLLTLHGPVAGVEWGAITKEYYKQSLFHGLYNYAMGNHKDYGGIITLTPGKAEGILLGGNLAILCSLLGTKYFPNLTDKVLCLEEINEPVYKVDRMLLQLKQAGVLENLAGVVIGSFVNSSEGAQEGKLTLIQVFDRYFANKHIPVFINAMFGHQRDNYILPFGAKVRIDSVLGEVKVIAY